MVHQIQTMDDVRSFFISIRNESVNFHPDNDFCSYINTETGEPTYSKEEAELRNELLAQCFEVCEQAGADIYEIGLEVFYPEALK